MRVSQVDYIDKVYHNSDKYCNNVIYKEYNIITVFICIIKRSSCNTFRYIIVFKRFYRFCVPISGVKSSSVRTIKRPV